MKALIGLFCLFIIFGCAQKKDDTKELVSNVVIEESDISEEKSPIPSFNYNELEEAYLLAKNDTTYVLNFWATWCKPCIKELPAFESLNENYRNEKLKVVLVSLDFPENVASHVVPFMEKRGLKSEVVLLDDSDANTWIPKVSEEWSGAIPATVMIKNGRKEFYERSFTYNELETEVKTIL